MKITRSVYRLAIPALLAVGMVERQTGARAQGRSEAVEVHARLINANTGEPISGRPVSAYVGRSLNTYLGEKVTNKEGIAIFAFSSPLPEWINVGTNDHTLVQCSNFRKNTVALGEILEHGVVTPNRCDRRKKRSGGIVVKPGEIVIFARPLRFWEH